MISKPTWMTQEQYGRLLQIRPQCCVACGTMYDLSFDHIVSRYLGGSDDDDNIQIYCTSCNSSKGPSADPYWRRDFYFDQLPQLDSCRALQRLFVFDKILDNVDWFGRSWSQISRRLYVIAAIVASGKTLAMLLLAHALNFIRRRILVRPRRVLTKY